MSLQNTKISNEEIYANSIRLIKCIKDNIINLDVDINVYNIKTNNINKCYNFYDSANTSAEELLARQTQEIEKDIMCSIESLTKNIDALLENISLLKACSKGKKLLKEINEKLKPSSFSVNSENEFIQHNQIVLRLDDTLSCFKDFKTNSFLNQVYKILIDIRKSACNLSEDHTEANQALQQKEL